MYSPQKSLWLPPPLWRASARNGTCDTWATCKWQHVFHHHLRYVGYVGGPSWWIGSFSSVEKCVFKECDEDLFFVRISSDEIAELTNRGFSDGARWCLEGFRFLSFRIFVDLRIEFSKFFLSIKFFWNFSLIPILY